MYSGVFSLTSAECKKANAQRDAKPGDSEHALPFLNVSECLILLIITTEGRGFLKVQFSGNC